MYIILMRHGEAEPETEDIANKNRSLTPKGMRQARKSARILSKFLKDNPIRIFTSPYQRTRQTAGILAEECFAEEIHTAEELLSSNWQMVLNHLISDGSPIALVSSSSLIYDHYQGGHLCTSSLCVTAKQSRRQKISPIKIVP